MEAGGDSPAHGAVMPWLTRKFREQLVAFVRRTRPNTSGGDVEDAIQDVLLRVFEKARSDAPPEAPCEWSHYMYRAVSNRLNDTYRKGRRFVELDESIITGAPAEEGGHPEQSVAAIERAALFQCVIELVRGSEAPGGENPTRLFSAIQAELRSRLKDRQWIVLRMRGIEGMGFQEIAEIMGVSLGSVHGWYNGALEVCAAILHRHGVAMDPS